MGNGIIYLYSCHRYGGLFMDKIKLVDKLRTKANISYEEAKTALENNSWDILDAMMYLEEMGRVKKPSISVFYTNEDKESYTAYGEVNKTDENRDYRSNESKNNYNGIFEAIIKVIDTCNNIFIEIMRKGTILLRVPLTVLILLFFFAFWIIIPLMIVALFFEIEFLLATNRVDMGKLNEVNKIFSKMSKAAQDIKEKFKKG